MLKVVYVDPLQFSLEHAEIPEIGADDVLLRILQVGICGSDIQIYHGLHQYAKKPLVMGHECAAIVERTGENVTHVASGDLVTVQPQIFCGKCYACRNGNTNVCEKLSFMGVHQDGFFAEYCSVLGWNVIKMPENATADMAMLTEPFAVAQNAVRKGCVGQGTRAVVIGAGTIGNLVAQAAVNLGAEVMITDVLDNKLETAGKCGIHHCVNTVGLDVRQEIRNQFGGEPADVIFDCAAVPALFEQLFAYAANGSRIVIVGNYKRQVSFDPQQLQRREICLQGVMQYTREDYLRGVEMISSGKVVTDCIITNRFRLAQLQDAFSFIDEHPGEVMKVAIEL